MKKLAEYTNYRIFDKDGNDITETVFLDDGRANTRGWSQYKLVIMHPSTDTYLGPEKEEIGWLYCGYIDGLKSGYTYKSNG